MARVLVIEDDSQLRGWLRQVLEQAGHHMEEAGDGRAGVRAYREGRHDAVLCDIVMPEQEGLETIQLLAKETPPARVVAISGGLRTGGPMDPLRVAVMFGACAALPKPFSIAELLDTLATALGSTAD
jgi:DNA-binding NtrC family response regulator